MADKPQTLVVNSVKDYDKILKPSPFKDKSTEVVVWQKSRKKSI